MRRVEACRSHSYHLINTAVITLRNEIRENHVLRHFHLDRVEWVMEISPHTKCFHYAKLTKTVGSFCTYSFLIKIFLLYITVCGLKVMLLLINGT